MAGWNPDRVATFKDAYVDFLKCLKIASKEFEGGPQPLKLYYGQRRLFTEIFDGLERDVHTFVCLKARQLGISTAVRALILFWALVHEGLNIALVYDTESNKEDARLELRAFVEGLAGTKWAVPISKKAKDSRTHFVFPNGSRISWMAAGTKKTKSSGGLGRSRGIAVAGCTEVSSWADIEGFRSFQRSLAQKNPNRLFIYESTARGFNLFHDLCEEAKSDDLAQKFIFIGWWAKEDYVLDPDSEMYQRYSYDVTPEEQAKIDLVRRRYGFEVTMPQLAWYRHEFDPGVDTEAEMAGEEIIRQELPWDEDEAWLLTGSLFFSSEKLTASAKQALHIKTTGYKYFVGNDFLSTQVDEVPFLRQAQLRVWEEPEPDAVYVVGADPAFGSSDESDRSVAQVLRCYADGLDQVAEFCTPEIEAYQFAWIIAHLCGGYGGATGSARLLLEVNGPGEAVLTSFRELQQLMVSGYLRDDAMESGLKNVFTNIRQYMYKRFDNIGGGPTAFHWKTTSSNKAPLLERLRDVYHTGQMRIRSIDAIKEMQKVVRHGDSIQGDGVAKDDRVVALALAVRAWDDSEKKRLIAQNRTRDMEERRRSFTPQDLNQMFQEQILGNFFRKAERERMLKANAARRGGRYEWL